MTHRPVRSALAVWKASRAPSGIDRRYTAYLGVMLAIVFVAPAARALWIVASQPEVLRALASPGAPLLGGICTAGLWVVALLVGRLRGPALRPPLLTYAFARSELPRVSAFGGSVVRAGSVVTAITTGASAVIGALLSAQVAFSFSGALAVTVLGASTGVCVGVITTVFWLAGQAMPRMASALAAGVVIFTGVTILLPVMAQFTPWGWIAAAWSSAASPAWDPSAASRPLALLAALATALVSLIPRLLTRLDTQVLERQAARWESSSIHAYGMDFNAAVSAYQARPQIGRRMRAVRTGGAGRSRVALMGTFVIRDVVGATRTPVRLAAGAFGVAVASVLVTIASTVSDPGLAIGALGACAAVIVFAALGPFTDGLRHAAAVAGDLPLYGVSDAQLLLLHAVFPASAVLVLMGVGATVSALVLGGSPLASMLCAGGMGLCAVVARASNALKGQLPLPLLTPIPTPEGDLSGAVRFLWSIDGIVLVALVGATLPLAATAPAWCAAACAVLLGVGVMRWRRRRTSAD